MGPLPVEWSLVSHPHDSRCMMWSHPGPQLTSGCSAAAPTTDSRRQEADLISNAFKLWSASLHEHFLGQRRSFWPSRTHNPIVVRIQQSISFASQTDGQKDKETHKYNQIHAYIYACMINVSLCVCVSVSVPVCVIKHADGDVLCFVLVRCRLAPVCIPFRHIRCHSLFSNRGSWMSFE